MSCPRAVLDVCYPRLSSAGLTTSTGEQSTTSPPPPPPPAAIESALSRLDLRLSNCESNPSQFPGFTQRLCSLCSPYAPGLEDATARKSTRSLELRLLTFPASIMTDYNSSKGGPRDDSRPTTPTASSRKQKSGGGMRTLNTHPSQQETFYDDTTPVDNFRNGDKAHDQMRDSHDLSLHDGTRDSVVDNMLLSLDQLPSGPGFDNPAALYSNFDHDDFFLTDNPYPPPKPSRHRGHTYASSHSSDYDLHPDDTSSRYSSHHSRGRRSNSSNNIPSAISRKGSLRAYPSLREKQTTGMFGEFQQTSHTRGTGKKGSKGSTSSSMDFGHAGILGTHRLGFGNRSASFDHGNMADRSRVPPIKPESVLERSQPAYQNYHHDYDAAPQPTIPAGPRRVQEPPQSPISYPPQPTYAPPQAPVPRRKNSVRSTTSRTLRKNKSQPEPNMRLQAQEFVNASNLRDLPPIPAYQDPPAPSPTVATRKHMLSSPSTPVTTPKEKPGFFRRVFGGGSSKNQPPLSNSSNNSNNSHVEASPASSQNRAPDVNSIYSQARPQTTPSSSNHIASQLKSLPRVPQTANSTQKEPPPPQPTLAKKHSSFFRRRKKSVSESTRPPIMALEFKPPSKAEIIPAQPSPGVSSLRKVMNPYLNGLGSPGEEYYDTREHQPAGEGKENGEQLNGFSPGYKPHKDATVRAVKPGSRGTNNTPPSSRGDQVKALHTLGTNSPKLKLKMRHGRTHLAKPHDDSFLADSSSCNEDRSGRATPSGDQSTLGAMDEMRRPKTSPVASTFAQRTPEGKNDRKANIGEKRVDPLDAQTVGSGPNAAKTTPGTVAASQSASEVEDEGWIITSPTKKEQASLRKGAGKSKRVWLEPTSSEEKLDDAEHMSLPMEGARTSQKSFEKASPTSAQATTPSSPSDVFHSASSLPVVQVESRESENMPAILERRSLHETEPTDADRERAARIFNGDEPSIQKAQAAAVLGDITLTSMRTRKAYMELFDWSGFNILAAMRDLCGKLVLKAETQQVDRILMSLSERWCECNPSHGFRAIGKSDLVSPFHSTNS